MILDWSRFKGGSTPTWTPSELLDLLKAEGRLCRVGNDTEAWPPSLAAYLSFYQLNFSTLVGCQQRSDSCLNTMASHCISAITTEREHTLIAHHWQLNQPDSLGTVFVVHGYFDHVGLYSQLIGTLLQGGYDVVAFDLPGHGLSSGEPAAIEDFSDYVHAFEQVVQFYQPITGPRFIVAQSTGAAIVMDHLLNRQQDDFSGIALLAPLVRPKRWHQIRLKYLAAGRFLTAVARNKTENSNDPEFVHFVHHCDPLQYHSVAVSWVGALCRWVPRFVGYPPRQRSLLVVQGDEDMTVDWVFNLNCIEKKFGQVERCMVPGGRHHLANESDALRLAIFELIKSHFQTRS